MQIPQKQSPPPPIVKTPTNVDIFYGWLLMHFLVIGLSSRKTFIELSEAASHWIRMTEDWKQDSKVKKLVTWLYVNSTTMGMPEVSQIDMQKTVKAKEYRKNHCSVSSDISQVVELSKISLEFCCGSVCHTRVSHHQVMIERKNKLIRKYYWLGPKHSSISMMIPVRKFHEVSININYVT